MAEHSVNEMEQRSVKFLNDVVANYKILIDTCSLLSEFAESFWKHIIPILKQKKTNVVVPLRVYEEVRKFADSIELCQRRSPDNPNLNKLACSAKEIICKLRSEGLVRILGDENDNFADNVFQTVFTQYRMKYNLLLITQDKNLAVDILRISESKAVIVNTKIQVRRINKYGYLSCIEFQKYENAKKENRKESDGASKRNYEPKQEEREQISEDEIFAYADHITRTTGTIKVSFFPQEGDVLIAERGEKRKNIRLVKAGKSGGEGMIYQTDIPNVVAKIYKQGKLDKAKYNKLKLMMTKSINCSGVCFPIALLYNNQNEFVGFLMNKAEGKELQKCLFIPQLLKKNFPNWKKKDTVQLCITILKKFKYLHDRNIILGDINPNNILVVSPTEVYFVDTDSYQIEGYPCPVGTINYTAPEIQKKKFETFLRSMGNEQFAVATLLFMIMLPGKPPYSLQGGENQIENIINGDFAYASGERTNGKAPEGVWRYIWSHLPRYLKDDFYETFRKGGLQSTEDTRFSDDDWLRKFEHYAELLKDENGQFLSNDKMSAELFPNRLKKDVNATYIKCKLCDREVDEERTEQGYCRDCLRTGEHYSCSRCGTDMIYTNYQKLIRHSKKYDICKACNDKLNSVYRRYQCGNPRCGNTIEITYRYKEILDKRRKKLPTVCKDCRDVEYTSSICSVCGRWFKITFGEKEYFDNKGFDLPKKCPNCRGSKATTTYGSGYYSNFNYGSSTNSSSEKKSSSFCYITTAACNYFNKPDDCYELNILRWYRDNWLVHQSDGQELVGEYYAIAPEIIATIDKRDDKEKIYKEIWEKYIVPCIKLIELTAYNTCKDLYIQMVRELKNKYDCDQHC